MWSETMKSSISISNNVSISIVATGPHTHNKDEQQQSESQWIRTSAILRFFTQVFISVWSERHFKCHRSSTEQFSNWIKGVKTQTNSIKAGAF